MDREEKIISFLEEIEEYKTVERKNVVPKLKRPESDAEHSWHLGMFIILFYKDIPGELDLEKMLKMSMVHDLMEIYSGDTFAYASDEEKPGKEEEFKAAEKLFSKLPEDLEEEFMGLFEEYEDMETKEAKVVKSFDKIQPILQNIANNGEAWENLNISTSDINGYKREYVTHDEFIEDIYNRIMKEAMDRGFLEKD